MVDVVNLFLEQGLAGVTKHYEQEKAELKKENKENNKNWARKFILMCIIFVAIYCSNYKKQQYYEAKAQEAIQTGLENASITSDSIIRYYNDPLVSDTVSDRQIKKMRSDIIKKHRK